MKRLNWVCKWGPGKLLARIPTAAFMIAFAIVLSGCGGSGSGAPANPVRIAPDASRLGPLPIIDNEFYKFPAACDNAVLPCGDPVDPTRSIELWAQIYRPKSLDHPPYPVIVLLAGNHQTCGRPATDADKQRLGVPLSVDFHIDDNSQYTTAGTCPAGYSVVDSHLGYSYLADRLAGWGYVVVSINTNRGISSGVGMRGDVGLIYARARMVLRHLQLLSAWNSGDSSQTPPNPEGAELPATLSGKLNLEQLALFGHSRGGEGVRAALRLYRDGDPGPLAPDWQSLIPDLGVVGIFEVGPTDFSVFSSASGPPLAPPGPINASGVKWNVLIPICDGDITDGAGLRPFDRMMVATQDSFEKASPAQKSIYAVWGTNHNFYNTEWQVNESDGCIGSGNIALFPKAPGSTDQQATAISAVMAFVRATFESPAVPKAANPAFDRNFNPIFSIPRTIEGPDFETIKYPTRVERADTPSPSIQVSRTVDDFDQDTGISSYGVPNDMQGIEIKNLNGTSLSGFKCPDPPAVIDAIPEHDPTLRGASLSWNQASEGTFLQVNWTAQGSPGMNLDSLPSIGAAQALEFRVSRRLVIPPLKPVSPGSGDCFQPHAFQIDPLNTDPITDLSVAIAGADGTLSKSLEISKYLADAPLSGPVGAYLGKNREGLDSFVSHAILQTVSIPLRDFGGLAPVKGQTRGVRFTFDRTKTGAIYLTNVRFINTLGPGGAPLSSAMTVVQSGTRSTPTAEQVAAQALTSTTGHMPHSASITSIRGVSNSTALNGAQGVEIDIASDTIFPVRDEPATLHIGGQSFQLSGHRNGDLHTIFFVMDQGEFAALPNGASVVVTYGNEGEDSWNAGTLDKSMLQTP